VSLSFLTILIFLVTLGLVISALYFIVEAPAAKRKLRERITSAHELADIALGTPEARIMRSEALSNIPALDRILVRLPGTDRINLFIQQSAVQITVAMLLFFSLLLAWFVFLACLVAGLPSPLGVLFGLVSASIPTLVIAVKRQRRFLRFEELFPDAIDLLGRAVRAGHAFTTGLELIANELPAPVSEEFRRAYDLQNLGLPLRDAFQNLARRIPLPDVRIFVTALTIQREAGGNLAEILDNLSNVMRERFKLMRQIKVYTAQGRLSMYMLIAIPPVAGLLLFFLDREYVMRLFTDPLGHRFLAGGVILQIIGYFVIRKIIQPKF
jgi:tight adherence protein B